MWNVLILTGPGVPEPPVPYSGGSTVPIGDPTGSGGGVKISIRIGF